jgi:uncharacterized membrane protein YhaH (DUF805 family)
MVYLSHLPFWLCGAIIVSSFVVLSIIGLALFQWLIVGRLRLTEEMNNDIIFFASAIAVFYSLTVGLIAAGLWRQRLHAIGLVLPSVMWSVVLIGAFLTITVTYLLKMQRIVHFVLTGFFAMFIGLVVFVIISLDQPLSGSLAIDSGPYQLVLDRLIDLK